MSGLRNLSLATQTALAEPVTAPGWLVQIDTAPVVRLSSRGDLSWDGAAWLGYALDVSGLAAQGTGETTATLRVGNTDNTLSALILGPGVAGVPVRLWAFYGETPALADPVAIFSGMADDAGINTDRVEIRLVGDTLKNLALPRGRCTPSAGLHHLTPDNTVLTWGNAKITLKREKP